ncbi:pyridoxal phosphate-dependent transferase [Lasiosphaeris hirsuta]|uniref:Pyridoxal phosphate-dependent transferase n=1 Tax=Lasiosphaeris hirsuta TaxID=260670 RepID=A0AA40AZI7_9PEZI|nr:pyridoxal phosphate-dependent transferase [Lasiosphaeris hirsuta]
MASIAAPEHLALGDCLPPGDRHGVSVHLPTWSDTLGWATRDPRILEVMLVGYPRFFIPRVVDKLAASIVNAHVLRVPSLTSSLALIVCSRNHAELGRDFIIGSAKKLGLGDIPIDVVRVTWETGIVDEGNQNGGSEGKAVDPGREDIYAVPYPGELFPAAKAFWQHTGYGISSRRATLWLENSPFLSPPSAQQPVRPLLVDPEAVRDRTKIAKSEIKKRIAAGMSVPDGITADVKDVFLYPAGMTAIAEVAAAIQAVRRPERSSPCVAAFFGRLRSFLYVDTSKVLTTVLSYTTTLLTSSPSEIPALEAALAAGTLKLDALFTEFPGNPLLQSPDLTSLHALARKYNFVLVVDDTVGTAANLHLLSSCDVMCTSLTKMFSGACNVMGGAVTLSPKSPFKEDLSSALGERVGECRWFEEDVLVMEENSRDFVGRVRRASANAEKVVVDMLRRHPSVADVYYPKGSASQDVYDRFRIKGEGYGFLLSVRFTTPGKAAAFYDALDVAKGPSLGTNFTLCCAYTLLAHPKELAWASEYGVVEDLVRISVGLEEEAWLRERLGKALRVAGEYISSPSSSLVNLTVGGVIGIRSIQQLRNPKNRRDVLRSPSTNTTTSVSDSYFGVDRCGLRSNGRRLRFGL